MRAFPRPSQVIFYNSLFAAALFALVASQVISDRRATISAAVNYTRTLNSALAEQTKSTLNVTKTAIEAIATELSFDRALSPETSQRLLKRLRFSTEADQAVVGYYVIDQLGRQIAAHLPRGDAAASISVSPELREFIYNPRRKVFLSKPGASSPHEKIDNQHPTWIVAVPIEAENRRIGIVAAAISSEFLMAEFLHLPAESNGVAGIYTASGEVVASTPTLERRTNQNVSDHPEFQAAGLAGDTQSITSYADGARRITATEAIDTFDAYVYTGLCLDRILRPWTWRSAVSVSLGIVALLVSVVMSYVAFQLRGRSSRCKIERARRGKLLAESSSRILRHVDASMLIRECASVASELVGAAYASVEMLNCPKKLVETFPPGSAKFFVNDYSMAAKTEFLDRARLLDTEVMERSLQFGLSVPFQSVATAPIRSRSGEVFGVILAGNTKKGMFTEGDLQDLLQLASIFAGCLENFELGDEKEQSLLAVSSARAQTNAILASITDRLRCR
jgi:hypothetical protein